MPDVSFDFKPYLLNHLQESDVLLEALKLLDDPELRRTVFKAQCNLQLTELKEVIEKSWAPTPVEPIFKGLQEDPIARGKFQLQR